MREHIIGDFFVAKVRMMEGPDRYLLSKYTGFIYRAEGTFRTRGLANAFARKEWAKILRQQAKERYRVYD